MINTFDIRELVDHQTWFNYGDRSWSKIDARLVDTINQIKQKYGYIMIVNTWHMKKWNMFGDIREFSGYRPPGCSIGKQDGAHYKGMAADLLFYSSSGTIVESDHIRELLLSNIDEFPYIQCLEIAPWCHIDVMSEKDSVFRKGCDGSKVMIVDQKNNFKWFDKNIRKVA